METPMRLNETVRESITIALLLMMQKKAFHAITITELTQKAGVGRVSFYRNFHSKEDVLVRYFQDRMNEWGQEQESPGPRDTIREVFNLFYKNREFILLLYRAGQSHLLMKCLLDRNGPKPEQPNDLAYWNAKLMGGLFFWCDEWIKRGMQETPEEMHAMIPQIVRNAVQSNSQNADDLWDKIVEIDRLIMEGQPETDSGAVSPACAGGK